MTFLFHPKRILVLLLIGFTWAALSSFYFYLSIKTFCNANLLRIATSLTQIISKKIETKVTTYYKLANTIAKEIELNYSQGEKRENDIREILISTMKKAPEFLSISFTLSRDYQKASGQNTHIVVTRRLNKQLVLENRPSSWANNDLSPFIQPKGEIFVTHSGYDPEAQVSVINFIRTIWLRKQDKEVPAGFIDIRIPAPYLAQFLEECLGNNKGHVILTNPEHDFIVGNHFLANKNLYLELINLHAQENHCEKKIGNQNFLIYKKEITSLAKTPFSKIYLFLPMTTFLYSQASMSFFLIVNLLVLFIMMVIFIIFLYCSLQQNKAKEQAYQDMEEELEKDALTDVYNRVRAKKYLKKIREEYNEKGTSFCCLLFDLDFFKQVNDTYGHDKGDYVLKRISHLIQLKIRTDDLLARIGGEEFLILLKDISLENTYKRSEFLRKVVANYQFPFMSRNVTISIGCAYMPAHTPNNELNLGMQSLIDIADKALYFSKSYGRNQTTLTIIDPVSLKD